MWEDKVPLFGVSNGATQKMIKIKYMMALIGHQLANLHTKSTNNKRLRWRSYLRGAATGGKCAGRLLLDLQLGMYLLTGRDC